MSALGSGMFGLGYIIIIPSVHLDQGAFRGAGKRADKVIGRRLGFTVRKRRRDGKRSNDGRQPPPAGEEREDRHGPRREEEREGGRDRAGTN